MDKIWDDKFGLIDKPKQTCAFYKDGDCNYNLPDTVRPCKYNDDTSKCPCFTLPLKMTKIIEGVGSDAEIIVNANGGKQSKSPMAMHLVDPDYLADFYKDEIDRNPDNTDGLNQIRQAIIYITIFMHSTEKYTLLVAMDEIAPEKQVIRVAKVLQEGATKGNKGQGYPVNNWRLIPQEEHINHALIHLIAHLEGDTQDNHLDHALCRLMMAYATETSEGFSYTEYVKENS